MFLSAAFPAQVAVTFLQNAPRYLFQITLLGKRTAQKSQIRDTEGGQMVKESTTKSTTIAILQKILYIPMDM